MAHTRCMLNKKGYTRARACTCPRVRASTPKRATRTRKHPRARAHTLTAFPRKQKFANAPDYYVTRNFPVLLKFIDIPFSYTIRCFRISSLILRFLRSL
jgi:hypothetical protein